MNKTYIICNNIECLWNTSTVGKDVTIRECGRSDLSVDTDGCCNENTKDK